MMTIPRNDSENLKLYKKNIISIADLLPDATFVINMEGKVVVWNEVMEKLTGVKAEVMLGKGDYEYALPFYNKRRPMLVDFFVRPQEVNEELYRQALRKDNSVVVEVDAVEVQGRRYFMWAKAAPLYDEQGQMIGAIESIRDITDFVQIETALRNSEQRLLDFINFMPDAIFAIDLDGKIIVWNQTIEEKTGFKAEDMLGKGDYEYALPFYGERRPMLVDFFIRPEAVNETLFHKILLKDQSVVVKVDDYQLRDKHYFIWAKAAPLYDEKGELVGAIESIRDITEFVQIEAALRNSEQRLSDIINFMPDAIFVIDLEGKIISWNKAIEEMTGVKAEDMLGKGDYEYALPFYQERRPMLVDFFIRPEAVNETLFHKILLKDQSVVVKVDDYQLRDKHYFIWAKAAPLYDEKGELVGAIESIRDITEFVQIEAALRNSEQRLSDIINFMPDAIFVIDLEGKIISWNKAIEEMTGVKAEDMLGKGDYEYALPFYGERRPILVDLVLMSNEKFEKEYSFLRREQHSLEVETDTPRLHGRQAWFWAKAAPLYDNQGQLVGAIESIRDISEQRREKAQLQYINFRDPVTGFYNRSYFLEELHRFDTCNRFYPAGLLICLVEGAKLDRQDPEREEYKTIISDITSLIRTCVCHHDILTSRISNNEFAILFSNCKAVEIDSLAKQIVERVADFNQRHPRCPVQITTGFAVQSDPDTKMEELFRKASNQLYSKK